VLFDIVNWKRCVGGVDLALPTQMVRCVLV